PTSRTPTEATRRPRPTRGPPVLPLRLRPRPTTRRARRPLRPARRRRLLRPLPPSATPTAASASTRPAQSRRPPAARPRTASRRSTASTPARRRPGVASPTPACRAPGSRRSSPRPTGRAPRRLPRRPARPSASRRLNSLVHTAHPLQQERLARLMDDPARRLERRVESELAIGQPQHREEGRLPLQIAPVRVDHVALDEVNLPCPLAGADAE